MATQGWPFNCATCKIQKSTCVPRGLTPEIEQRLDQLVAQTGRTKSYYLRELIEGGLDDLEDFYLADATMERVRRGSEKLLDATQVRKDLGLDH
jgi:RHH-type rel operon transcriptional repressor/antitoxin RelB